MSEETWSVMVVCENLLVDYLKFISSHDAECHAQVSLREKWKHASLDYMVVKS